MQIKNIKVGAWYLTKVGVGKCLEVGNFKGHAEFNIVGPFPRGKSLVPARDIEREVDLEEIPPQLRSV